MLSRVSVYRSRRAYGWRRRAAWREAGVVVRARRARLALYAQSWTESGGPLTTQPPGTDG